MTSENDSYSGYLKWLQDHYTMISLRFPNEKELHIKFHDLKESFFKYKLKLGEHIEITDDIDEIRSLMKNGDSSEITNLNTELNFMCGLNETSWIDVGDTYDDFIEKKKSYYNFIKSYKNFV